MSDRATSWATSPAVRKSMRANRRRDTSPELAVRKLLHAQGLRYRVDYAPDPGRLRNRADIVFTRARVAVFIDGCYWHGCPEHHRAPASNHEYWIHKVAGNIERDQRVTAMLRDGGWIVLRFWEHQDAIEVAQEISGEVRSRSGRRLSRSGPLCSNAVRHR